jgi:hypothetical protein
MDPNNPMHLRELSAFLHPGISIRYRHPEQVEDQDCILDNPKYTHLKEEILRLCNDETGKWLVGRIIPEPDAVFMKLMDPQFQSSAKWDRLSSTILNIRQEVQNWFLHLHEETVSLYAAQNDHSKTFYVQLGPECTLRHSDSCPNHVCKLPAFDTTTSIPFFGAHICRIHETDSSELFDDIMHHILVELSQNEDRDKVLAPWIAELLVTIQACNFFVPDDTHKLGNACDRNSFQSIDAQEIYTYVFVCHECPARSEKMKRGRCAVKVNVRVHAGGSLIELCYTHSTDFEEPMGKGWIASCTCNWCRTFQDRNVESLIMYDG